LNISIAKTNFDRTYVTGRFKEDASVTDAIVSQNFFDSGLRRQINLNGWLGGRDLNCWSLSEEIGK
jgi:hypothetical protein